MTRYLLDTNILSDMIDNERGPSRRRIRQIGSQLICTSIIAAGELLYGALRRRSNRLTERVEMLLAEIVVEDFVPDADRHYAYLRTDLERKGTLIGANDMLQVCFP